MNGINLIGCLGFSRTLGTGFGGILSRVIRMFTSGEWSHVFVVLTKVPWTEDYFIIEAGEFGVRINLLSEYTKDKNVEFALYRPKVGLDEIKSGFFEILPLNGCSYGYLQLIGFVAVWPYYMVTGKRRKNPFGGGIICSELGLFYLRATCVRPDVFDKMDKNLTSPEDLNDVIDTDRENFDLLLTHKDIVRDAA